MTGLITQRHRQDCDGKRSVVAIAVFVRSWFENGKGTNPEELIAATYRVDSLCAVGAAWPHRAGGRQVGEGATLACEKFEPVRVSNVRKDQPAATAVLLTSDSAYLLTDHRSS